MSAIYDLALNVAAHNHVAIEDSEKDSLDLFRRLKAMAEEDSETQIISLGDEPIPSEYDYMTVGGAGCDDRRRGQTAGCFCTDRPWCCTPGLAGCCGKIGSRARRGPAGDFKSAGRRPSAGRGSSLTDRPYPQSGKAESQCGA